MDAFTEFFHRFWTDMVGRTHGPESFRFYLQPTMALVTALIDGIKDAKTGRTPYFWKMTHDNTAGRKSAWREGFTATMRILLLGVAMDVIYQFKVFGGFKYPNETLLIALVLGWLPYVLLRGPIDRIASYFLKRPKA